jgi:hypothetical protein
MAAWQGFHGRTDKGTRCFVINQDATRYKVRLGVVHGYTGDHTVHAVISYTGKTGWIAKDKVTRVRL